jgi:anti-sigma B factor antagonist
MDIKITQHKTIAEVTLTGRFDAFNAGNLRDQLYALLDQGTSQFVLDLSQTPFLDSAAMAVLVSLLKRARQQKGDVKLVWPQQEAARRILNLTRFDRVFDMSETAAAALQTF